jgi:hypothetical protein
VIRVSSALVSQQVQCPWREDENLRQEESVPQEGTVSRDQSRQLDAHQVHSTRSLAHHLRLVVLIVQQARIALERSHQRSQGHVRKGTGAQQVHQCRIRRLQALESSHSLERVRSRTVSLRPITLSKVNQLVLIVRLGTIVIQMAWM